MKSRIAYISEENLKIIIERIMFFNFDTLMDDVLSDFIELDHHIPISSLIFHDRHAIYKQVWTTAMQSLYATYLPHEQYEPILKLEVTPFTFFCCSNVPSPITLEDLIEECALRADRAKESILVDIQSFAEEARIDLTPLNTIPPDRRPANLPDQILLLRRMMNFPPLMDIHRFYSKFYRLAANGMKKLLPVFSSDRLPVLPEFTTFFPLHFSGYPFRHECLQHHSISKLKSDLAFADDIPILSEIDAKVKLLAFELNSSVVCACCGGVNTINEMPNHIKEAMVTWEQPVLSVKIGFFDYDEFQASVLASLRESFVDFQDELNRVEHPACLVLVEGESEAQAIPILAIRSGQFLRNYRIKIHNTGSKEKLALDLRKFISQYPDLKIIALLDNDAEKEFKDIERMIKGKLDRYHVIRLFQGTFEDIFPINIAIDVLNELYPDGQQIVLQDFDNSKSFLATASQVLYEKKKSQLDKVLFAVKAAKRLKGQEIPPEIGRIKQRYVNRHRRLC